mgnify:CR=1 FL=1
MLFRSLRLLASRPLRELSRIEGGLDVGGQLFQYKPDSGFSFLAPSLTGRFGAHLHAGDPELGHDFDLTSHARFEYRGYMGARTDLFLQLGGAATWQGPVLLQLGYTAQLNFSSKAGESYQRHLPLLKLAFRLPGDLYVTAKGQLNLLSGTAGLFVPASNVDDDNRSLALLDLERRQLDVLEEHPERAPSAEAWLKERRSRLVELAKLAQDRLGDNLEAIGICNRLLELEEGDDAALTALAALYERERRFPALIEVLGRQKARTKDAKAQVALLERMGALLAEKLSAAPQAVEVYQEIVRLQPTHQKAMRTLRELYGQAGQYDELERLYGEQGQWDELYEVLLGLAERAETPTTKIDLYLRAARVAHKDLRSQEKAQRAYERVLLVDAQHLGAAQALSPIYKQTEKWPRLLAMYEILLGHAQSDDERLALMGDISALAEEKLSAKPLAFSWLSKAYAIREREALDSAPRVQLESELLRLASEADAWADLVGIYARQVPGLDEGVHKLARLRQLAQWTQHKLHRLDDARGYWEQVLTRASLDEEAMSSLEQIFLAQDKFPELLAIYRKRVETATDVQKRTEVLFKMAQVEENKLGDRGAAAATYRRILAEPETMSSMATTMRALRALEKIYTQSGDSESLAEVLERQLQQIESSQAAGAERSERDIETQIMISFQLGELYELHLTRPEKALERYRQVLTLTSGHRPTLVALERFLSPQNPVRVEVARLLVPAYEKADDVRKLSGALEIVLGATVDSNEELELLRRLSGLVRRLGDVEQAYKFSARLFSRVPFDGDNRRELIELAEALDRQEDLATLLGEAEQAAARAGDNQLARDLAWDLGQLYDEQLHQPEQAEQAYARVLERDETHEGAAKALETIYRSGERFRELRALLERRKDLAVEPSERKDLLFQICDLDEGVLEDEEAAAKDYAEILELEPASVRAFKALERLHTAAERWRDLDELLARAVPHVDSAAERAQLRFRRGELHAGRLDDAEGACELLEEALSEQPKHKGARRALEKLMTHPGLRQRIARTLEPLFHDDGDWAKLAGVLRVQREALPDAKSPEAAALLSRIARITEESLREPGDALIAYREAVRLDPADVQSRGHVERIATQLGRFEDLAAAWEEAFLATDEDNLALRGELLRRAAELYDNQLVDPNRARDAWKRLLDLDPTSLDTAKPAAVALARLSPNRLVSSLATAFAVTRGWLCSTPSLWPMRACSCSEILRTSFCRRLRSVRSVPVTMMRSTAPSGVRVMMLESATTWRLRSLPMRVTSLEAMFLPASISLKRFCERAFSAASMKSDFQGGCLPTRSFRL